MDRRLDKTQYYLNIARAVALRGTCLRRNSGAVIVKNDQIISTGYTGSPRGFPNCNDENFCVRNKLNCRPGEGYHNCMSVHAEANAIIHAPRELMINSTIYISTLSYNTKEVYKDIFICNDCKKMILNAGISDIVLDGDNPAFFKTWDIIEQLKDRRNSLLKEHK